VFQIALGHGHSGKPCFEPPPYSSPLKRAKPAYRCHRFVQIFDDKAS
jgi:hypothetical protein